MRSSFVLDVRRFCSHARSIKMTFLLSMCLTGLGQAGHVFAQTLDYESFEVLFEEPITASVTGSPQRVSEVPATMEIITAEEIRRSGARDIPGVLKHLNGVNILQWTYNGVDVGLRGYNEVLSSRLLVLVDGRQVYADHYGNIPWALVPVQLNEIRQIEVVKGPNSALFGFNAVGGVINIITYNPRYDDVNDIEISAGTQDRREVSLISTLSLTEKVSTQVSLGAATNDDFSTPQAPVNTGTRQGDERRSLSVVLDADLGPKTSLSLSGSYAAADITEVVGGYSTAFDKMTAKSIRARLNSDSRLGLLELSAYRNYLDIGVHSNIFGLPDFDLVKEPLLVVKNRVDVLQVQDIFKVGSEHTIRLSVTWRNNSLDTTSTGGATVSYDVYSTSGMWDWQLSPALTLTSAIRHDRLELERTGRVPPGYGLSNAAWDVSHNELSFNSGLVWILDDRQTLRLIAARGIQLPNLFDLGGNLIPLPALPGGPFPPGAYVSGLPGIRPSAITNYELAWDKKFSDDRTSVRLSLFSGKTSDQVADFGATLPNLGIFTAPANIGDSKAWGMELSLKSTSDTGLRWGLGYLYEDVDDDFLPQFTSGVSRKNYEDTTPQHSIKANLGWTNGTWTLDGYLYYQSDFANIEPLVSSQGAIHALIDLSAYTTVDARLAYQPNSKVSLEISGQNLLHGEQRQTMAALVERRVMATVKYSF